MPAEQIMALADRYRDLRVGQGTAKARATLQSAVKELEAENARLREALTEYDALIRYQYTGSREAMHALTKAAKNGMKVLNWETT